MKPRPRPVVRYCSRLPHGRLCRILIERADKILIRDLGFWTGWVSRKTFETKWRTY